MWLKTCQNWIYNFNLSYYCVFVCLSKVSSVHKLCNAFFAHFDHPPTYIHALDIILLITYSTRVCNSNAFACHPTTSIALRYLWTAPYKISQKSMIFSKIVNKHAFTFFWGGWGEGREVSLGVNDWCPLFHLSIEIYCGIPDSTIRNLRFFLKRYKNVKRTRDTSYLKF